ncbi:OmpA family protein [Litorivicinus lipolyticus]|uniref:OmpA family protein n=1 Tax=Litorivicinus lipolyticus TaxID=418701 RepID=UPI003B5ACE33
MKKLAMMGWLLAPFLALAVEREASWVIADLLLADTDGDTIVDHDDRCPHSTLGAIVASNGCTLWVQRAEGQQLNVQFDSDESAVKPRYMKRLQAFAARINGEARIIELSGHTDARGSADYNQGLSERRAQAVFDVLVGQYGVNPEQLKMVGYSESLPLAAGQTSSELALNRRVQADIVELSQGAQFETVKTHSE